MHPTFSRVEEFVAKQNIPGLETDFGRHSHQSTAHTVIDARASRTEHQLPHHPPSVSHIPGTSSAHSNFNRKLRLELNWGLTMIKMWLELDNPAEAFLEAFQKQVIKQRSLPDRKLVTIYLKTEQRLPNDASYPLSLDQEDLEADWAGTVSWLEENSREISPHVFGTIVEAD